MRKVQVDTVRETERLIGELVGESVTVDIAGERQALAVDAIQYYTNLDIRTGTLGHGTLYLRDKTVVPLVQLLGDVTVRTAVGLTFKRKGPEVVLLNLDTASF
jgi:hypothetical protein